MEERLDECVSIVARSISLCIPELVWLHAANMTVSTPTHLFQRLVPACPQGSLHVTGEGREQLSHCVHANLVNYKVTFELTSLSPVPVLQPFHRSITCVKQNLIIAQVSSSMSSGCRPG